MLYNENVNSTAGTRQGTINRKSLHRIECALSVCLLHPTKPLLSRHPPIHKHTNIDWLVNRKQLPANWHEPLKLVKEQVKEALRGLEEGGGEVAAWVKGKESSAVTYYTCQQIMSLLERTQQGRTKNIFGSYTVAVLKTWDGILRAYRKDNIFLGEAAQLLATHTTYTCPAVRRRIAGHEKQIEDCDRRVGEYRKAMREGETRFQMACGEWGVSPGEDVWEEGKERVEEADEKEGKEWGRSLVEMARQELPCRMEEVERLLCMEEVGKALLYYQQVWRFLHSYEPKEDGKEGEDAEATTEFFPVLCKVRRGEKLLVVKGEEEQEGEKGQGVMEIDWDADAPSADEFVPEGGGGGIDWNKVGQGGPEVGSSFETITHETELNVTSTSGSGSSSSWNLPPAATAAPTKTGLEGQGGSLLADASLRAGLLNDVMELESFLRQRRLEVGDTDNVVFVGQFQGSHAGLQQQSVGMVDRYLKAVKRALDGLQEKRLQQLWLIHSTPVYAEKVVQGLRQHRRRVRKLDKARRETVGRREEAVEALAKALPEYEATAAATTALKKRVEMSLKDLFKGRDIFITGGVNAL